jgi:glycosyltransferase involved in cell wall biosynthesis
MRKTFIISTGEILNGKTAGARRIMNIARSLASGDVTVYLCSLSDFSPLSSGVQEVQPGILSVGVNYPETTKHVSLKKFLRTVNSYIGTDNSETVIYLYPTTFIFRDFVYLLYFKYLKGHRLFCEINELRSAIAFSSKPPSGFFSRLFYCLKSIRDYLVYRLNEFQVPLYDGIVVISTNLGHYFNRKARKMIRVPILCDAGEINPGWKPPLLGGESFKICFAGYIKYEKEGFDLLFEALSVVSSNYPVELYMYGILADEDRTKLERTQEKYSLSGRIFYMGNIEPEKLQDEFHKYHLLILPRPLNKRTMYGFSTKLSEYLISGSPVLLTDVSDNALFIRDNYNGYLIPPGDVTAMAEKLKEIIATYNDKAESIVENAHRTVREEFDYRLFSDRYIDFFFNSDTRTSITA